jgi:Fe-S-cluster containining protein
MAGITAGFDAEELKAKAAKRKKSNKKLITRLKKMNPRELDEIVHQLHDEKFRDADCLECGNCCRSISPIITDKDINRISRHLKVKPSVFKEKYLALDDEDDYVFRRQPCPFLGEDNYCQIYQHRPRACRDFPLTERIKFYQTLDVSMKNTFICPVVFEIFEELKNSV